MPFHYNATCALFQVHTHFVSSSHTLKPVQAPITMVTNDSVGGWITLREAAVRLRAPYAHVLRLLEIGKLSSRRTESGRWLVTSDSVDTAAKELATTRRS